MFADNKMMVLWLMSAFLVGVLSITPAVAQLQTPLGAPVPTPSFDNEDAFTKQCWSSAFAGSSICIATIYASFINGTVTSVPPSCCKPITEVSPSCWPKLFAFKPQFSSSLKGYCDKKIVQEANIKTLTAAAFETTGGLHLEELGVLPDIGKCMQSLQHTPGCIQEAISSFFSMRVGLLGPACCKAIISIEDSCWSSLFPFATVFESMAKSYCSQHLVPQPPTTL